MGKWLGNFAYSVDLNVWVFFAAGMAALGIALISVGSQSIKAALSNPVEVLKHE